MMPNGDPQDGLFYPTLTLMMDSYNIKISSDDHGLASRGLPSDDKR